MNEQAPDLWFRYTFTFDDGVKKDFEVRLDARTLTVIPPKPAKTPPAWTRLGNHRCENCPLKEDAFPHCPIAGNMSAVVEGFADIISYKEAEVLVETAERSMFKRVPVQSALYSLMGIYMSASGCPVMDVLKPLVRFHLPFATVEETYYRVISMYVTAQYLRMKSGLDADWELANVKTLFEEIHTVNIGFSQRLHSAIREDALVNSVSILDVFAHVGKVSTPRRAQALRQIFTSYLEGVA